MWMCVCLFVVECTTYELELFSVKLVNIMPVPLCVRAVSCEHIHILDLVVVVVWWSSGTPGFFLHRRISVEPETR